jgi:HK97 family phage major capsid protein
MPNDELKKMLDELKSVWSQFQEISTRHDTEIKTFGEASQETKAFVDKLNGRMDELQKGMDDLQVQLKRSKLFTDGLPEKEQKNAVYLKTFDKFLRYGSKNAIEKMEEEEKKIWAEMHRKSLSEGDDSRGGIFVPEDFRMEVIRKLPNFARVGGMATRQTTSQDVLRYPAVNYSADDIKTSGISVTWEDETDSVTETDMALGSVAVPIKKMRALIKVSQDLLEDSAVNVVDLISTLLAEAFGIEEDSVFTTGSGPKRPEGFMTNSEISSINSGDAALYTYNGIVDLVYNLPEQYAANASFMTKRLSMGELRKIKDSQGQPLWQPAMAAGQPATLLGYPVFGNEHIPALAANATPIVFGDFRQAYLVGDRVGMTVRRLDEKYADTDEVGFIARRRVGGKVKAPWAMKKQKIAT